MQYSIENIDNHNKSKAIEFLKQHEDYSMLLLGNLDTYGFQLSDAPYSGNFKLILFFDQIIGVLCLTKNGSLLIQANEKEPIFDIVLASCIDESIPITGLIGKWDFCHAFWEFLKEKKIIQRETFTTKEILYSINLSNLSSPPQSNARLLSEFDYDQWKPIRLDYLNEEGLPNKLSDDQLSAVYLDKVKRKIIWGYFLKDKLVSVADLNAKALDLGQVGGVYTIPSFRMRGYSKAVMQKLLFDEKSLHSIRKLIIFTGEKNYPAQKLYHALGVENIGYFALLFGS